MSVFSFTKHAFAGKVFILMLFYRKQSFGMQEFSQLIQYLLAANSIGIIEGYFNYDLLKVLENKLLDYFADTVHKPMHISGSLVDHIHVMKTLMEEFSTNLTVENIYFLDIDVVKIAIEKDAVNFDSTQ